MAELGYQFTGIPGWASLLEEQNEPNPDLLWPLSLNVYDRMRSEDAQVGSVMRAVTQPILSTEWAIDPAGAPEEAVQLVADDLGLGIRGRSFVAPLRTRDRFNWTEHVRLALLELVFGHSVFEQVYRLDESGRQRLAKLAFRPHRTISKFGVASDGGLEYIEQYGALGGSTVRLPISRLVVYVHEREGGNWIGRSLFRTAYKNWLAKDRFIRVDLTSAERNGLGIPVYEGTPLAQNVTYTPEDAKKWHEAEIAAGLELAKKLKVGMEAGVSVPGGAKFALKGVDGTVPEMIARIRYHDEQIARAVLAHFLNLGTETGSWALGSTFADFFTNSLNAVAQQIAAVAQAHVVEDLIDVNFGPTVPAPRIVPAKIGAKHPATAESIKALLDSGAIEPDEALEAEMRSLYGLPVKDAKTRRDLPPARTATTGGTA